MRSSNETASSSDLQAIRGTTGEKCISADDLLALREFFLLLDALDRNSNPATPVDRQTESAQGERHACAVSARRQRAA